MPETFASPHLRRISALCAARSFAYRVICLHSLRCYALNCIHI